ncbi:MAG: glycosyltransferase, partial [Pseudomonadota bacterium]
MSNNIIKIAIVIPVFNRVETTLNCLRQLQEIDKNGAEFNFIIVDDGSTDGTADAVKTHFPDSIVLMGDGNLWWTGAINMGAEYALKSDFDYVLCLNDDLEFDDKFLTELLT